MTYRKCMGKGIKERNEIMRNSMRGGVCIKKVKKVVLGKKAPGNNGTGKNVTKLGVGKK